MDESGNKDGIINKIKVALQDVPEKEHLKEPDGQSPVFLDSNETPEIRFVEELQKVNGKFVFCLNETELLDNLVLLFKQLNVDSLFCVDREIIKILEEAGIPYSSGIEDFYEMKAGVTTCEFLISRTGSVMVSSGMASGRRMNVFPPVHIVLAYTSQLVSDLQVAFLALKAKYPDGLPSMVSVITGPSRTADIEKTLVLGAHGPKEIFVFLVNDVKMDIC